MLLLCFWRIRHFGGIGPLYAKLRLFFDGILTCKVLLKAEHGPCKEIVCLDKRKKENREMERDCMIIGEVCI